MKSLVEESNVGSVTAGFPRARPGARVGLVWAPMQTTLLREHATEASSQLRDLVLPPMTGTHVNLWLPCHLGTHGSSWTGVRSQSLQSAMQPPVLQSVSGVSDCPILSKLRSFDPLARTPGHLHLGSISFFHFDVSVQPEWVTATETLGCASLSRKATVTPTLDFISDYVLGSEGRGKRGQFLVMLLHRVCRLNSGSIA